jgi:PRC-barrel domain protein
MSVFTLEVAGKAVACIDAASPEEARQELDDPWFRDGLLGVAGDDRPVWRGDAEISVRAATPQELALVQSCNESGDRRKLVRLDGQGGVQAAEHKLILASRVEHTPAFNGAGERIGHIEDLSIDRKTGRVIYAIMSFGGFLGIGKRFHPLPWHMLRYDPERGGYLVSLDKQDLEDAPHFDADELRELGGSRPGPAVTQIWEYYGRYGPLPI